MLLTIFAGEIDVFRLDISMHKPRIMDCSQTGEYFHDYFDGTLLLHGLCIHPVEELFAVEQFHGQKGMSLIRLPKLVDARHIRRADCAADLCFTFKALCDRPIIHILWSDHFQCHWPQPPAVRHQALRSIDLAHTPSCHKAQNLVESKLLPRQQ